MILINVSIIVCFLDLKAEIERTQNKMENTNFQLQETLDKLQAPCPLADFHAPYLIKNWSIFGDL